MNVKGVFFDLESTLLIQGDMSAPWFDWLWGFYESFKRHDLLISKEASAEGCDQFFTRKEPPKMKDSLTIFEQPIQALCSELKTNMKSKDTKGTKSHITNITSGLLWGGRP